LESLNRALIANDVKPVVDKVYKFDDARQAYHDMRAANHFGKLVIEI